VRAPAGHAQRRRELARITERQLVDGDKAVASDERGTLRHPTTEHTRDRHPRGAKRDVVGGKLRSEEGATDQHRGA
jgi:hypothetical protein